MTTDLSKEDLINLVTAISPTKKYAETFIPGRGSYGRGRGWTWDRKALEYLDEKTLFDVYNDCKKSWQ